jgi:hypothetical protein
MIMANFLPNAEKLEFDGLSGSKPRRRDAPARLVLHTTEGRKLPEYSSPPHFTVAVGHPESLPSLADGKVKIWQHISLEKTAYSLLHPKRAIPETNHMGSQCVQIEMVTIVGDIPKAHIVGNRGQLPELLLRAVAGLISEILDAVPDIPLTGLPAEQWSAKKSFGPKAKQRLSVDEWTNFNGICGHQHVPINSHWDPGALDIAGLLGLVKGNTSDLRAAPVRVAGEPTPPLDTGWPKILRPGDRNQKVVVLRGLLQALGFGMMGDTDLYNQDVASAVERLQKDAGIRVDGKWGAESHRTALGLLENEMARADVDPDSD